MTPDECIEGALASDPFRHLIINVFAGQDSAMSASAFERGKYGGRRLCRDGELPTR